MMSCSDPLLNYLTKNLDFMAVRCPQKLLPLAILRDRRFNSRVSVYETSLSLSQTFQMHPMPEFGRVTSARQGLSGLLKLLPLGTGSAGSLDRRTGSFWFQDVSRISVSIETVEDNFRRMDAELRARLQHRIFHSGETEIYRYWVVTDVLQSTHFRIGNTMNRDTTAQAAVKIPSDLTDLSVKAVSEYDDGGFMEYQNPSAPLTFAYRASRLVFQGGEFVVHDARLDRHAGDDEAVQTSFIALSGDEFDGIIREIEWPEG